MIGGKLNADRSEVNPIQVFLLKLRLFWEFFTNDSRSLHIIQSCEPQFAYNQGLGPQGNRAYH